MAAGVSLRWPAEDLWQALSPQWPGFSVEVVADIDSTNAELMRRARAPDLPPTLLVAEHQQAGRGRLGRTWHSAPGESLMMSLGLTLQPAAWTGLSLVVGVVLAEVLDPDHQLGIGLKWPNDVWAKPRQGQAGPRKLAGILIETVLQGREPGRVVIGIGLNVRTPDPLAAGHAGFRTPPVGLADLGDARSAPECLAAIVPVLMQALRQFEQTGWEPWRTRYHARDVLRGRAVRLSDGREGQALEVDEQGAFRLATPQGVVSVHGDEVSLSGVDVSKGREQ
ncbi:MAG: biotin--[acetyl-CoA-carboxylase] ligase, partial [Betaproteobacteria bacterium]|jgi:BirA family transcriptional regulator, biotin operon repressor / biotin---[acetyl-CoA-carboxylase] ligase|nr:biotin--[acetyl-CoA-carboxylase] ligase [Betaproteobacteria bacterium]